MNLDGLHACATLNPAKDTRSEANIPSGSAYLLREYARERDVQPRRPFRNCGYENKRPSGDTERASNQIKEPCLELIRRNQNSACANFLNGYSIARREELCKVYARWSLVPGCAGATMRDIVRDPRERVPLSEQHRQIMPLRCQILPIFLLFTLSGYEAREPLLYRRMLSVGKDLQF